MSLGMIMLQAGGSKERLSIGENSTCMSSSLN